MIFFVGSLCNLDFSEVYIWEGFVMLVVYNLFLVEICFLFVEVSCI